MADRDTKLSLFTSQLPREIRNEIYRYLLLVKNARCCVENSDRVSQATPRFKVGLLDVARRIPNVRRFGPPPTFSFTLQSSVPTNRFTMKPP